MINNKMKNFESISGIAMIILLVLVCVYQITQSSTIQTIGLYYGLVMILYSIYWLIKLTMIAIIELYKWIKGKLK